MNNIVITEAAENDLAKSSAWYEEQQEGLSKKFLKSFFQTLDLIQLNPLLYQERYNKIYRAAKMHRFPFLVIFKIKDDGIFVNAVFHTSRRPVKKYLR